MRKWTVLAFLLLTVSFTLSGQNEKVSINRTSAPISVILEDIENQTEFLFIYKKDVNVDIKKTVVLSSAPLADVLNTLFKGTSVKYEFAGKHIVLFNHILIHNCCSVRNLFNHPL